MYIYVYIYIYICINIYLYISIYILKGARKGVCKHEGLVSKNTFTSTLALTRLATLR